MNPTHDTNPRHVDPLDGVDAAAYFVGLLTGADQFHAWLATAPATASQPQLSDTDVFDLTDAGRQAVADQPDTAAARVLRCAALYLERHGWIQGAYYDVTTTVFTPAADMVGAIAMACYGGPVEAPAQMFDHPEFLDFEQAVLHLDRWLLVQDGSESYEFNDAHGRRKADVIAALRQAAATSQDELVDALRALDQHDELADRARALTPRITLDGALDSGDA